MSAIQSFTPYASPSHSHHARRAVGSRCSLQIHARSLAPLGPLVSRSSAWPSCMALPPRGAKPPLPRATKAESADLQEPKPPAVRANNWGKKGGLEGGDGLYQLAGLDMSSLSSTEKTTFTLITQISDTVVTLALIRVLTVKKLDEAPEESVKDIFNYSPSNPFQKPYGWAVWAGIGIVLSPFIVGATAYLMSTLGYDEAVAGGRGTADGVASLISMDLPTYLSLASITGILAPILEETVFRGFLLTSLTKFMPAWGAVIISSTAFGLAHVSPKDFPVLVVLGSLLGFSYVRSRNLLTPILIHGVWNSSVLSLLFYLSSIGVDLEAMMKEAR
eukprot:gene30871-35915_t